MYTREELVKRLNNSFCNKCGLYTQVTTPLIYGSGDIHSNILIIGEAPGFEEDRQGIPFIGRSGALLRNVLNAIGVSVYISNAVKCRPIGADNKNREPSPKELDCCSVFTHELILKLKPKVILLLGSRAVHQILQITTPMTALRAYTFYHNLYNAYIVATYHPSFLLRNEDKMYQQDFVDDVQRAASLVFKTRPRKIQLNLKTLDDPFEIKEYLNEVLKSPEVAIDIETLGTDAHNSPITDISFCIQSGSGVHIKWQNVIPYFNLLKDILESKNIIKIFHNSQFELSFFKNLGIDVQLPIFDTMLAFHCISSSFEGKSNAALYGLKTLAWIYTTEGGYQHVLDDTGGIVKTQKMLYEKKKEQIHQQGVLFDTVEIAQSTNSIELEQFNAPHKKYVLESCKQLGLTPLQYYSAMDADVTFRIYKKLKPTIDQLYSFTFYDISMPLSLVLADIHLTGISIDLDYINQLMNENRQRMKQIESIFYKKVKRELNLNSPDHLRKLLFEDLKLTPNSQFVTQKKNVPSTDEEALNYYAKKKAILKYLLEYRSLQKMTSTFLKGYQDAINKQTGRVHPRYEQLAATFRLTCTSPNLQQIPQDNKIRNMIIPKKGAKLIVCDLSQIELRILAMMSHDVSMINAFKSGVDLHTYTACIMFNIALEEFDKKNPKHSEYRSAAKSINFGIVYQMSATSLANRLDIKIDKAVEFMDKFFKSYPNVKTWINQTKQFAMTHGYVENLYKRRRYLPGVRSTIEAVREAELRKAVNTPIQSSAGDIFFIGMLRIARWFRETNKKSKIVGTVHDSVLIESPYEEVEEVSENVINFLTKNIPSVTIDLEADLDILDKWQK